MKFDLSCKKHPKYKAVRAPKTKCGPCWILSYMNTTGLYVTSITQIDPVYKGYLIAKRLKS